MRPNHQRRQRGRNGKPNKFPNRNQSYDSNGPDVRVRGTAHQIFEKYQALAREAATSGDRVMAEAYYQHAEHYFRIIQAQGGFVQPRYPQPWEDPESTEEAPPGPAEGPAADGGLAMATGMDADPADGPQPSVEFPQRGGAGFNPADDYQPRDGSYNGEERYRGRDEGRGGDGRGFDQRRQDRREDDSGYGQRGRRDFVTRAEQRYQDRQDRFERGQPGGDRQPAPAQAEPGAAEPVQGAETPPPPVDGAPDESSAGDKGAGRDGRSFRPRHPHFRRFRGGPRGQNGVDPAQQDQPDLTGSGSGGSGNGT
jgi:hypothetical protein